MKHINIKKQFKMQICWRNCKPLIAAFSLIVASKALCATVLPPGRASAAAVLPHSDLSSEIRVTRNQTVRREGKEGAGAPSPPETRQSTAGAQGGGLPHGQRWERCSIGQMLTVEVWRTLTCCVHHP